MLHQIFLSIIAGGLADRFGPKVVTAVCCFFAGLGFLLMSQVRGIWQLYLFYGVIVGIGLSAIDVVLLSTVARWFIKKRGIMSGVVKVGTGLGLLIMPLVASVLISIYDWRTAYIILGVITLVSTVSLAQLLRRDPAQVGQSPDGELSATNDNVNSLGVGLSLQEVTHTRQFWMICLTYLTIVFTANTIMTHIALHAIDLGVSEMKAAGIISIIGAASIVGRLVIGNTGDRLGHKQAMIICFLVFILSLLWLQFAKESWMLYLFAIPYGFAHGGFFAIISPMVAGLFGTRAHGIILGIVFSSGTLGGAIGSLLGGYLFDITGSYRLVFLILLIFSVAGLILIGGLRPIKEGGRNDSGGSA